MKVYFVGAGPGDPKLLTLKGAEVIARCPIVLYTGSLVPRQLIAMARSDARVLDSASMTLPEITSVYREAKAGDLDVARVHTGDPSIFGSMGEQLRKLDELRIDYEIVPGVSSFTAAAAVLKKELTLPELSQTVIVTRAEGRTPMPPAERLAEMARARATMVFFLSAKQIPAIREALIAHYGADCPVAVVYKATWPDQKVVTGTLADIEPKVRAARIYRHAIIVIGWILTAENFANSKLYDPSFAHRLRKAAKGAAAE